MTETERAALQRKFLDAYGRWFPSHVKDKELWATVKRGVAELLEQYPADCRRHQEKFDEACRAGSLGQHENLGFVLEEFKTRVILADNEERKRQLERALPSVSQAGMKEYLERLSRIQVAYNGGRITRGQMLSATERAMRDEGMPEAEIEEIVGAARQHAERQPGGLDGTLTPSSAALARAAMGAISESTTTKEGERVEADGR